jgi:3-hydroxybutyryl-CoA dehydrogenase
MKNIAVIGSGTMGNGIAHVFAQMGHSVSLIDINQDALDRALQTIDKNMDRQVGKGVLSPEFNHLPHWKKELKMLIW